MKILVWQSPDQPDLFCCPCIDRLKCWVHGFLVRVYLAVIVKASVTLLELSYHFKVYLYGQLDSFDFVVSTAKSHVHIPSPCYICTCAWVRNKTCMYTHLWQIETFSRQGNKVVPGGPTCAHALWSGFVHMYLTTSVSAKYSGSQWGQGFHTSASIAALLNML